MRHIFKLLFWLILFGALHQMTANSFLLAQQNPKGPYLGLKPPGLTVKVFAPGIISLKTRYEYSIAFSADGRECCFGVTNSDWSWCDIYYMKQDDESNWSHPEKAYFQKGYDGWLPFFAQDGKRLFFSSGRPDIKTVNIYVCEKNAGQWGEPAKLPAPVNSPNWEWRATTTLDGRLFFMSNRDGSPQKGDIYFALPKGNDFTKVKNLGPPVNSKSLEASPFISPDGKYLLLECWKAEGFGQADLYISYLTEAGAWTVPQNLGVQINTDQIDDGGYISPDGKYFFFNRRKAWKTDIDTDIYWVDSRVIFKPYLTITDLNVTVELKRFFSYTIPAGTFADYDDVELKYSAGLANGEPLPNWLNFDDSTLTFSGTPNALGTLKVRVSARDSLNSKADLDIRFLISPVEKCAFLRKYAKIRLEIYWTGGV